MPPNWGCPFFMKIIFIFRFWKFFFFEWVSEWVFIETILWAKIFLNAHSTNEIKNYFNFKTAHPHLSHAARVSSECEQIAVGCVWLCRVTGEDFARENPKWRKSCPKSPRISGETSVLRIRSDARNYPRGRAQSCCAKGNVGWWRMRVGILLIYFFRGVRFCWPRTHTRAGKRKI